MPDIRPSTLHPTLTFSALPWHWVAVVAKQQFICSSAWLVSRCRRQDQHHNSYRRLPTVRYPRGWNLNSAASKLLSSWGLRLPFDTVENLRVLKRSIQTLTTWVKKFTNSRGIQDDLQQNSLSSFIFKTHPRGSWLFYFASKSSVNCLFWMSRRR